MQDEIKEATDFTVKTSGFGSETEGDQAIVLKRQTVLNDTFTASLKENWLRFVNGEVSERDKQ